AANRTTAASICCCRLMMACPSFLAPTRDKRAKAHTVLAEHGLPAGTRCAGLNRSESIWLAGKYPSTRSIETIAMPHSITSSARASKLGGISSPSALAVLRLITSSNFVRPLDRELENAGGVDAETGDNSRSNLLHSS